MLLIEAQTWLIQTLINAGIEPAEAEAESRWMLLETGLSAVQMRLNPDQPLSAASEKQLKQMLERRQKREPLQHILGHQPFWDLNLKVSPDVLIPRPETEELVELALAYLPTQGPVQIADMGTGSGAIALALAQTLQKRGQPAEIWASDLSEGALAVAQENAQRNQLEKRVLWLQGDGLTPFFKQALQLDLLVSNPPYIPLKDWQELAPEVKDFEPRLALTPGEDALLFYRLLASEGSHLLKAEAWLCVELDHGMAQATLALFQIPTWQNAALKKDLRGCWRFLCAQKSPSKHHSP